MLRAKCFGQSIVFLLAFGLLAEAQSKLNFPRQLSAAELSTTGLALVNTSSTAVTAIFSFYGTDGVLVTQSNQNVPAKGQLARLASEIFPTVNTAGWVQITSSSAELQGFQLVGDFANVVDGAGPAAEGRQLGLIDFSREDVVHIVNASSQSGTVQVALNNAAGQVLGTRSIPLAAFQPASLRLGDVSEDNNIDLVTLSSDVNISASLTTKLPGGLDIGLTNATVITGAPSTLFFPFAPNGPQGVSTWTTYLGISNLASSAQNISITFNPDSGAPITIQRNLAAGATVGDTVANLFGVSGNTFTAGWIRVNGSGGLAGVAAYRDAANGSLAIVPSQSSAATAFFFGHIASLSPWYTGIALLNPGTIAASVEVYAINSSGQLWGSLTSFSLPPGRRTSLLSEFVPQVLQRATDGGWVFVRTTNNVPLLGFELFGHGLFPILANVQGFALPPSSTFTPPGATGTSGADIQSVTIYDSSGTLKTQFTPGNSIAYAATITNTGSREPAQLSFSVKDPRNNTLFSISLPITLPATSAEFPFPSFIPMNALNGQYTFTATLVHQGKTVSKSATFNVSGGTNTPSVGQEFPISLSFLDDLQVSFRPSDTARFLVGIANFTGDTVTSVLNYQLTGPGPVNAGSSSITFAAPPGISERTIDIVIPANSQQGIFVFNSSLTASGTTTTRKTPITVVPKSPSESIEIDHVFVSDSNRIPRAGFTPGSGINLHVRRVSSFGVSIPGTMRYTVTGPDSTTVFDDPFAIDVPNGAEAASLPFTLSASASPGTYTFQATITYQDNSNATKTSTKSTTFVVGSSPPALVAAVSTLRLHVEDVNFIARTSFSNEEPFSLVRTVYSTFPSAVAGTVQYQVMNGVQTLYSQTFNATFTPGLNTSVIDLIGPPFPNGTVLTFNLIATVPGVPSSTNTTTFTFTAPSVPALNLMRVPEAKTASGQAIQKLDETSGEHPARTREMSTVP